MCKRKTQFGQAMVEYLVGAGVVILVLVTPITIDGKTDTAANLVLTAIKSEHAGFLYAVGQPARPN